jgi:hypothetical protein
LSEKALLDTVKSVYFLYRISISWLHVVCKIQPKLVFQTAQYLT